MAPLDAFFNMKKHNILPEYSNFGWYIFAAKVTQIIEAIDKFPGE